MNNLRETNVKNRTCSFLDDIIKVEDFDFDNTLLDKKSHENILHYDISYKTLIGAKPFGITFDKFDNFVGV